MNAYRMFEDLRDNVVESVAAHWDDAEILRKMNKSQRKAATIVLSSPGDWLMKSATLTPSSSLVTLPNDCAKPVYMEDYSSGVEIPLRGTVRERRMTRPETSARFAGYVDAYLVGGYIEINQSSYSDQVTLWYQQRVPDLHFGEAGSGSGASTLIFDSDNEPSLVDDYYNNVTVEVMTATGADIRSSISDYTGSSGTATITGTPAEGDPYGTVTVLPLEAVQFIIADATCGLIAKPGSSLDPRYFEFFLEERKWAVRDLRNFLASRVHGGTRTRIREL